MAEDVLLQESTVFHRYALNGKLAEQYSEDGKETDVSFVLTLGHGERKTLWKDC